MKREKDALRSYLGKLPDDSAIDDGCKVYIEGYAKTSYVDKQIEYQRDKMNDYLCKVYDKYHDLCDEVGMLKICVLISSCLNVIVLAARIMGY